ncbi:hypothetical protein HPP92_005393 [Vanilla planifolia]|uniref:Uncharacterized protein n=1 Tax=Vanilla planifolia TaxID=51239 RepID=A0A835VCK6_VANPL|nr:hypothetical protein HPP92_005393 [Vanilla planifolia]
MEYTGNAVLSAYGEATVEELETWPLGRVVDVVVEGGERMVDEYVRSVIDWGGMHRGYPRGNMFVSSWWRLGFADVEYGWGRPVYCCPVVHPMRDIVLLFPTMGGADKGVNVLVALPREDMEKFAVRFYNFLEA